MSIRITNDAVWWQRVPGTPGHTLLDLSFAVTLAHNLAMAGGLCWAHEIGRLWGADEDMRYTGWSPGCGKRAPIP